MTRRKKPGCGRHSPSSFEQLAEWLREAGYRVALQPGGHYKVFTPDGGTLMAMPASPSDGRSLPNCIAEARKRTGLRLRK